MIEGISYKRCAHCAQLFGPNPNWPGNFKRMKFCGVPCSHARKKYSPEMAKAKFWSRVDMNGPNGCWLYKGARDKWGYGDINYLGKHIQAHRLAWLILRGDPANWDVLHTCHNPSCCNPAHLYLGTDADNARDRVSAGRVLRGENAARARLTEAQAKEIIARSTGEYGEQKRFAREYGVAHTTVGAIIRGNTWKHIHR